MRIVSINLGNAGSTGSIARNIKYYASKKGIEVYTAYPASKMALPAELGDIIIGKDFSRRVSRRLAVATGLNGCFSHVTTLGFISRLNRLKPDIIHLHNLHHSYINLPMLFRYIKKNRIKTIWTLHDCWAFTGQCAHFTMIKCDKWEKGCHDCPQYRNYPEAAVDRTSLMWKKKKEWFSGIESLHIVTPSHWLSDLVRQSYLKDYDIRVINNGIDIDEFSHAEGSFKKQMGLEKKKVILGVAFGWGEKKGYDVLLKLADKLPDEYVIVIVGNVGDLPRNDKIIYINRTHNKQELAKIYASADVLANPTREDNFPTVNIEALACGAPVVTFDTGGSPEIIDCLSGSVVEVDDYEGFEKEILRVTSSYPYRREDCIKRADMFSTEKMLENYIKLYNEI